MWLLTVPLLIYSSPLENLANAPLMEIADDMNSGSSKKVELRGGHTIILREARFSGNDAVSTEDLNRLANPYLHKPFDQRDLRELQGRIKILYRGKGYTSTVLTSTIEKHYEHYVLIITIQEGRRNPARQR